MSWSEQHGKVDPRNVQVTGAREGVEEAESASACSQGLEIAWCGIEDQLVVHLPGSELALMTCSTFQE